MKPRRMVAAGPLAALLVLAPLALEAQDAPRPERGERMEAMGRRGAAGPRMAGPLARPGGAPGLEEILRLQDRLDLTEGQRAQLAQLRQEGLEQRRAARGQMDPRRALVQAGQADAAALREARRESMEANAQERRQLVERARSVLTPEQRAVLEEARERARTLRSERAAGPREGGAPAMGPRQGRPGPTRGGGGPGARPGR